MRSPRVEASTIANIPRYIPIQKSARARLQIRNLGTFIVDLPLIETNSTVPFPNIANMNTIHIPHLKVHHPKRSLHGRKGPVILSNYDRHNDNIVNYRTAKKKGCSCT